MGDRRDQSCDEDSGAEHLQIGVWKNGEAKRQAGVPIVVFQPKFKAPVSPFQWNVRRKRAVGLTTKPAYVRLCDAYKARVCLLKDDPGVKLNEIQTQDVIVHRVVYDNILLMFNLKVSWNQ